MALSKMHKKLLSCTLAAAMSFTAQAADLQERLSATDSVVKLSDLFTDTGDKGDITLMPAPAPGKRMQITSYQLSEIAKEHGLDWQRPSYLKRVYFYREGEHYSEQDLVPLVQQRLQSAGILEDMNVRLFGLRRGFYLPVDFSPEELEFESFNVSERRDRFEGMLLVPTSEHENQRLRVTGTLTEVRLVPVFNRLMVPGDIISADDIDWKKHPAKRINLHVITATKSIIGQTVKRAVAANKPLNKNDIAMPVMIAQGSTISVKLKSGLLSLTLKGRALDDGGKGDLIRVMNIKSKRSFEARVVSPGTAVVEASSTIQIASR